MKRLGSWGWDNLHETLLEAICFQSTCSCVCIHREPENQERLVSSIVPSGGNGGKNCA